MNAGKGAIWAAAAMAVLWSAAAAMAQEGGLLIEKVPTRNATVSRAYAAINGGKLEVAGKVSRRHPLHTPGHVEVGVYDAAGDLLARDRKQLPGIMSQRRGRLEFSFSSRFDFIPPPGSTIRVRYSSKPSFLAEEGLPE